MANLVFTKSGSRWVATATITEVKSLHVERASSGYFGVGVKSKNTDEKYAFVKVAQFYDQHIDIDLVAAKYPKYLVFESDTEVTNAYVD